MMENQNWLQWCEHYWNQRSTNWVSSDCIFTFIDSGEPTSFSSFVHALTLSLNHINLVRHRNCTGDEGLTPSSKFKCHNPWRQWKKERDTSRTRAAKHPSLAKGIVCGVHWARFTESVFAPLSQVLCVAALCWRNWQAACCHDEGDLLGETGCIEEPAQKICVAFCYGERSNGSRWGVQSEESNSSHALKHRTVTAVGSHGNALLISILHTWVVQISGRMKFGVVTRVCSEEFDQMASLPTAELNPLCSSLSIRYIPWVYAFEADKQL